MMAHVMAVMLFLLIFLYNPKATDSLVEAENMKHKLLVCNDDAAPPYNVTVLMCHGNTVLLEWQFDKHQDNLPLQLSFIIEYNTSHNPNEWVVAARLSADDRRAKITVPMWTTFTFRVKAVNEMGVGKASAISHTKCKTPPGRPDRHPRNVRTIGDKMSYLVVEWEPMPRIEHNAPGFFYNINVRKKDGSFRRNVVVFNYTVGRIEIPVQEPYQPYIITVGAENQLGRAIEGVQQILGYSGEAYPRDFIENFELDPDKNVTPTSAPLRWDPVDTSPEAVRGVFRGYKVHYWWIDETDAISVHEIFIPDTSDADITKKGRQSDKIRTELHNLPSSTEIEAYVEVVNNYYSSEQSRRIKFLTLEGDNLDLWELKYSSADVDNTPLYTKNNTRIQLTCAGTFPNPVGDVTGEWRMLDNRFLIPPSHSRLVTSLISSPAHHYNGTLTIANVLVRDSGNFTFSLRDESGRDVCCTGPVQVYGPPLVTLLPLKNVFIKPWETILLSCNVTQSSTNDTVITWFRNGVKFHGESTQLMDCATTGINATYSCLGENTFGKGRKSDDTTVYRVQAVNATTVGPTPPSSGTVERKDIECTAGTMDIHIPRTLLPTHNVTLRDPTCVVPSNGTHLVISISFNQCGTTVSFSNDTVVFSNELVATVIKASHPSSIVDYGLSKDDQRVSLECVYKRHSSVELNYMPMMRAAHFYEKRYGNLDFEVKRYTDEQFTTEIANTDIPTGVNLNSEIFIDLVVDQHQTKDIGIYVPSCFATPTPSPTDPLFYPLIRSSCPAQADVRRFTAPDINEFRFSFLAFKFTRAPMQKPHASMPAVPMVYIHCQVSACPRGNCTSSCNSANGGRMKRAALGDSSHLISTGPFFLKTDESTTGYSSIVVAVTMSVAVAATVVAMAAIVAWRRSASKLSAYKSLRLNMDS